jgi:hypothetical protein
MKTELDRLLPSFLKISQTTASKSSMDELFASDEGGDRKLGEVYVHVAPQVQTWEHTIVRDFIVRGEEWSAADVVEGAEHKFMCPLDPNKAKDMTVLLIFQSEIYHFLTSTYRLFTM